MGEVRSVTSTVEDAKVEVATVLASVTFARSPRMTRLLRYLCDKIFAGETAHIKEYSIAVDLLGRPASFDPAEDAIARVEVHRLRKKLKEYYESEGFDHRIRIVIPSGSYVPIFVPADSHSTDPPAPAPVVAAAPEAAEAPPQALVPASQEIAVEAAAGERAESTPRYWLWMALAVISIAGIIAVWRSRDSGTAASPGAAKPLASSAESGRTAAVQPAADGESIRIGAGRTEAFRDGAGRVWSTDQFYSGGESVPSPGQNTDGTPYSEIFQAARMGNFQYNIPLGPGTWELRLYFVERQYGPGMPKAGGENSRVFHVLANNRRILSDLDIVGDVGPHTADIRAFKDITADAEGLLHLNFISGTAQAMVSAIEITRGQPRRMNPIRLIVSDSPYKDSTGRLWEPDNYWRGGRMSEGHAVPVRGTPDPNVYARERYGHFSYAIPVSEGTFDVTVHLAETYWGSENPGGGGVGTRVFDVFCNGVALARGLDIYAQVGANRSYPVRFKGLKPNAQGKLNFEFVPVKNYASVHAIVVEDVTP